MKLVFLAPFLLAAQASAQSVLLHENFESGFSNWTMTGLWNDREASQVCSNTIPNLLPYPSGTHCAWYGSVAPTGFCNFLWSPVTPQFLTYAHPIALPATTGSILLSFQTWSNTENSLEWDMHGVEVREISAPTWTALKLSFDSQYWRLDTRDLTPWAGQTIELRFNFNAVDESWNDEQGWFLDDVKIVEDAVNTVAMDACSSDSSWLLQCPCSNSGGAGRGCKSSVSDTGAGISASGAMRVSADTLVLHVDGMSEAAATVFQASGFTHSNSVALAGDGLSCVTGSFVRLVTRYAPGGVLDFPGPGDAPLSLIGGVSAGQTLYYGARYRDAATFCGAPTYNMSNTISAFWRP